MEKKTEDEEPVKVNNQVYKKNIEKNKKTNYFSNKEHNYISERSIRFT